MRFLIGVLFCMIGLVSSAQHYKLGDTLPVIQTPTFKLDSVLDKPMLMVFWASWNPASMEMLETVKSHYYTINPVKRGVEQTRMYMVDFSIDQQQGPYQITLKRENLPWKTHVCDFEGWESELVYQFKITQIPSVWVIDEHRCIIACNPDPKQLRNMLLRIVKEEQAILSN